MRKTPGVVTHAYYAVPEHYTIGTVFDGDLDGLTAAVAYARSTIKRFDYFGGEDAGGTTTYSRAFVDEREVVEWATGLKEDRMVRRIEVFLTDAEKGALR